MTANNEINNTSWEAALLLSLGKQDLVGDFQARKILARCENQPNKLLELTKSELQQIEGIGQAITQKWDIKKHLSWAEEQVTIATNKGDTPIGIHDPKYPNKLRYIPDAPLVLFMRGSEKALHTDRSIAVVGTRQITEYGKKMTQQFVRSLSEAGVSIISGLAYGVDAFAHNQALQNNSLTGAVLGHGLHMLYPQTHQKLADKILAQNGFLLTEFPYNAKPDRHNFPKRNRIVAGMTDATLVIETSIKGGSMVTASLAQQYNKDVFAIPGRIGDEFSSGCHELIKHNLAHLASNPEDIFKEMGWLKKPTKPQPQQTSMLMDDRFISIFNMLEKPLLIDELCAKSGKKQSEINGLLTEMELEGMIKILPGKRVSRS